MVYENITRDVGMPDRHDLKALCPQSSVRVGRWCRRSLLTQSLLWTKSKHDTGEHLDRTAEHKQSSDTDLAWISGLPATLQAWTEFLQINGKTPGKIEMLAFVCVPIHSL